MYDPENDVAKARSEGAGMYSARPRREMPDSAPRLREADWACLAECINAAAQAEIGRTLGVERIQKALLKDANTFGGLACARHFAGQFIKYELKGWYPTRAGSPSGAYGKVVVTPEGKLSKEELASGWGIVELQDGVSEFLKLKRAERAEGVRQVEADQANHAAVDEVAESLLSEYERQLNDDDAPLLHPYVPGSNKRLLYDAPDLDALKGKFLILQPHTAFCQISDELEDVGKFVQVPILDDQVDALQKTRAALGPRQEPETTSAPLA